MLRSSTGFLPLISIIFGLALITRGFVTLNFGFDIVIVVCLPVLYYVVLIIETTVSFDYLCCVCRCSSIAIAAFFPEA